MLDASARNWRRDPALSHDRGKLFIKPRFRLTNPGPRRMSRPLFPNVYWLGTAKAPVLNHFRMVRCPAGRFPLERRLGSHVPLSAPLKFEPDIVGVKGIP